MHVPVSIILPSIEIVERHESDEVDRAGSFTRLDHLIWPAPSVGHIRLLAHEGTRAEIDAMLTFVLVGRGAEAMLIGAPSFGSGGSPSSDLARATCLAAPLHASHGADLATAILKASR